MALSHLLHLFLREISWLFVDDKVEELHSLLTNFSIPHLLMGLIGEEVLSQGCIVVHDAVVLLYR